MGRILTIEEYSKHYLNGVSSIKTTSIKKIIKEELEENPRVREFLPLYCAINKKYNDLPIDILEKAIEYRKELETFEHVSDVIKRYMTSFNSYNHLQDDDRYKRQFVEMIQDVMAKKKISTYKLNKEYGINLKIAAQIKKGELPSCSASKLQDLFVKIR